MRGVLRAQMFGPDRSYKGDLPLLGGSIVARHNDVSSFVLDVNTAHHLWGRVRDEYGDLAGWHVILSEDGEVITTGIITGDDYSRQVVDAVSLAGVCHLDYVDSMVTLPSPSRPLDDQSEKGYYTDSGAAGAVIGGMVRALVGESARLENRAPITVPASGIGAHVKVSTRFKPLLEEVQGLALRGGTCFGARMNEAGDITFNQWVPRDLTRHIRLSEERGALQGFQSQRDRPTVTRAIVAGQGEAAARTLKLVEGNTPNKWGVQRTIFLDQRQTDDYAELIQAGQDALVEGQETASVTVEITDVPGMRYLTDYRVGDKISVEIKGQAILRDTVQVAELDYTADGRTGKLTVGPAGADPEPDELVKTVAELRTRIRHLETR